MIFLASLEWPMSSNMTSAFLPARSVITSLPPGWSSRYADTSYTLGPPLFMFPITIHTSSLPSSVPACFATWRPSRERQFI